MGECIAESTKRCHKTDWIHFSKWCAERGINALPATPETVCFYMLAHEHEYKPSYFRRKLAGISKAHQGAGFESPTRTASVRKELKRIQHGMIQSRKGGEITKQDALRMFASTDDSLQGIRDKALLLFLYVTGFRRSEVSNLNIQDITFLEDKVCIRRRFSKTNQDGAAETTKDICMGLNAETCPVRALRAWLDAAGVTDGPVFRCITKHDTARRGRLSGASITRIVKRYAAAVGLDPEKVSAHGFRYLYCDTAFNSGVSVSNIIKFTGHSSVRSLMKYVKREPERQNISKMMGL